MRGKKISLEKSSNSSKVIWWEVAGLRKHSEGFPGGSDSKESACNAGDLGLIPGSGDLLEKGMVTHWGILAWRIPVHGVTRSWTGLGN